MTRDPRTTRSAGRAVPRLLAAGVVALYSAAAILPCPPRPASRIEAPPGHHAASQVEGAREASVHTQAHAHVPSGARMAHHAPHAQPRGPAAPAHGAADRSRHRDRDATPAFTAPCACGCGDHTGAPPPERAPLGPALPRVCAALVATSAAAPPLREPAALPAPPLDPIEHVPIAHASSA